MSISEGEVRWSPDDPITWFTNNYDAINAAVHYTWTTTIVDPVTESREPFPVAYNLSRRNFSEMPLCYSWTDIYKQVGNLPNGFRIMQGKLYIGSYPESRVHEFLANDKGEVFCHTSAQTIIRAVRELGPGDRIGMMRDRAVAHGRPDLYRIIGDYGVIFGHIDDIQRHLHLRYELN